MDAKILITNNTSENHSGETWATVAAEMLADATVLDMPRRLQAQRMQLAFAEVLATHFDTVSAIEQKKLKRDPKHVMTPLEEHIEVQKVADELVALTKNTAWEQHYQRPEVCAALLHQLRHLFYTSQQLDRLLHADQNPTCQHAQAYRAQHHGV